MIKGWLKSIPPESRNPQGAGPWRITFCGIVDSCFSWFLFFLPEVCVRSQAAGGRVLSVEHLLDRAAHLGHLLGSFTHPTAVGTALYPCALGDVSQSLGFSTHRGEYQPQTNKVWMLESLQRIHGLYLLLQRPPQPDNQLQGAVSWVFKGTPLLVWYQTDYIAAACSSYAMHSSGFVHDPVSCKQKYW